MRLFKKKQHKAEVLLDPQEQRLIMPFPPYSNDYPEPGNIDYDLFVIDSGNRDSAMYQIRDCIKDALEVLEERIAELERRTK